MSNIELEQLKKQHESNYKNAVIDIIKNNNTSLVDQDIMSLLKKPPLDSMDSLRNKLLEFAKKNKIVLNVDALSSLLDQYRNCLIECCFPIKKTREEELLKVIEDVQFHQPEDIIKINKSVFTSINKKSMKYLKEQLKVSFDQFFSNDIDTIFVENTDPEVKDKIIDGIKKYMKGNYQKQLLENYEIKTLVKDTTLINSIKEQGERYLFTLNNSRLLNDFDNKS